MGSNWVEYKLDEIAILRNGAGIKQQFFSESSIAIPLVKVSNFTSNSVDVNGLTKVDHEHAQKWISHTLDVEDIVVATVGSWPLNWSSVVGKVVRIPQLAAGAIQNQNTCAINPKDNMDKDFLYYVLKTDSFINYVVNVAQGSANQARVPVKKLGEFKFKAPFDIEKQRQLVNVLVNADKKIELNQKTNQTLEQMAQALFKSWFVDFDPVFDNLLASADFKLENLETSLPDELIQKAQRRLAVLNSLENVADVKASLSALAHELQAQLPTKEATQAAVQILGKTAETPVKANFSANPTILAQHANTHAHFPSEFEHNEQLGWIPKGWEYGSFSKIAILKTESIHPKKSPDKLWSQFSLPAFDSGKTPSLDLGIEIKSGKYKLSNNVVLVSKLNPQTPRVWMPNVVDVESSVCSTEFMPFEPILEQHKAFIYALMSSKFIQTEIASRVTGTTGSHQRVSPKNIAVLDVILPSENCIKLYCEMVGPSFNKINLMSSQSTELTKLRDTLLPKLISGELQIPDIATDEEVVD